MSTNLGDVWTEIRIDTRAAERDLDELERRMERRRARPADPEVRREAPARKPSPSGTPSTAPETQGPSGTPAPERLRRIERALKRREIRARGAAERIAEGARPGMAGGADPRASMVGGAMLGQRFGSRFGGVGRLAGGAAGALMARKLPGVGMTAIAYETARAGAFLGTAASEVIAGATGFEGIIDELRSVRTGFQRLESEIASLWNAVPKTRDFVAVQGRIAGTIPAGSLGYYYSQFQRMDADQSALRKKFESFKTDSVLRAFGDGFGKMVSDFLSQ